MFFYLQGDAWSRHFLINWCITEEESVVLNIGGQCFSTSRVTLGADISSLIGVLLRKVWY